MSIYFMTKTNDDFWNPASMTGRLFCDQVASIARELKTETGLGPIVADEVMIDEQKFLVFAEKFTDLLLHTGSARPLLDGCFSIVAALAVKLGGRLHDHEVVRSLLVQEQRRVG